MQTSNEMSEWKKHFLSTGDGLNNLLNSLEGQIIPTDISICVVLSVKRIMQVAIELVSYNSYSLNTVLLKNLQGTDKDIPSLDGLLQSMQWQNLNITQTCAQTDAPAAVLQNSGAGLGTDENQTAAPSSSKQLDSDDGEDDDLPLPNFDLGSVHGGSNHGGGDDYDDDMDEDDNEELPSFDVNDSSKAVQDRFEVPADESSCEVTNMENGVFVFKREETEYTVCKNFRNDFDESNAENLSDGEETDTNDLQSYAEGSFSVDAASTDPPPKRSKRKRILSSDSDESPEIEESSFVASLNNTTEQDKTLFFSFSEFKCFLCSDKKVYKSIHQLSDHIARNHHLIHDYNGELHVRCPRRSSETCGWHRALGSKFPNLNMKVVGSVVCHLIKTHNMAVPKFVDLITCSFEGCNFFSWSKSELDKHVISKHELIDKKITKHSLHFHSVKCFVCENGGEFLSFDLLANHLTNDHQLLTECTDGRYLKCPSMAGKCNWRRAVRHGHDSINQRELGFVLNHMVRMHRLLPPNYVRFFVCKVMGCSFMSCVRAEVSYHERRATHNNLLIEGAQFHCPTCDFNTASPTDLKNHMMDIHKYLLAAQPKVDAIVDTEEKMPDKKYMENSEQGCLDRIPGGLDVNDRSGETFEADKSETSVVTAALLQLSKDLYVDGGDQDVDGVDNDDGSTRSSVWVAEDYDNVLGNDDESCDGSLKSQHHVRLSRTTSKVTEEVDSKSKDTDLVKVKNFTHNDIAGKKEKNEEEAGEFSSVVKSSDMVSKASRNVKKKEAKCKTPKSLSSQRKVSVTKNPEFEKGSNLSAGVLKFSIYKCFICNEKVFENFDSLSGHIGREHHLIFEHEKELHVRCPKRIADSCGWHQLMGCDQPKLSLQMIAITMNHLIRAHKMPIPGYVSYFTCNVEGCKFSTYHEYLFDRHMATHKNTHKHAQARDIQKDQKDEALHFTSIKCFLCENRKEFKSFSSLADHIKETHNVVAGTTDLYLRCPRFRERCNWCKTMMASRINKKELGSLLNHLIKSHHVQAPDYVKYFKCSVAGCPYTSCQKSEVEIHESRTSHNHVLSKELPATVKVECPSTTNYPCSFCGKVYQDKHYLILHTYRNHDVNLTFQDPIRCSVCDYVTILSDDLKQHMSVKHGVQAAVEKSGQTNTSEEADEKDLSLSAESFFNSMTGQSETSSEVRKTPSNETSRTRNDGGKKSKEIEHRGRGDTGLYARLEKERTRSTLRFFRYQCQFCLTSDSSASTAYGSFQALWQHTVDEHFRDAENNIHTIKCPYCDYNKSFNKSKPILLNNKRLVLAQFHMHMINKHNYEIPDFIEPFCCRHVGCESKFIRKHHRDNHELSHSKSVVPCDQCGKLVKPQHLKGHAIFCASNKTPRELYPCEFCDKSYKTKGARKEHIARIHMDKRNFLCNLCSGRYADKFQLEEHTIRVHGLNISDREVLKCNLCPYNTFKKSSMTLHMSSKHNETKTHQCLVCNKFFKNEVLLKNHARAHGERTYRCPQCTYTACKKQYINQHVKAQHTLTKFECDVCGYQTGYYANLCKHKRITSCKGKSSRSTKPAQAADMTMSWRLT